MKKHAFLVVAFIASIVGWSREAAAEIVTFEAHGNLTLVQNTFGAFPADLATGDEFVVTFSFDTSTPAFLDDGAQARYFNPVTALSFTVGGFSQAYTAGGFSSDIYIANDQVRTPGTFSDVFAMMLSQSTPPGTPIHYNVDFQLANIDQPALSDGVNGTALEAVAPDLAGFVNRGFRVTAYHDSDPTVPTNIVFGQVSSVSVVPTVPLPAAGWLLMSALGGFAALGRRRASTHG